MSEGRHHDRRTAFISGVAITIATSVAFAQQPPTTANPGSASNSQSGVPAVQPQKAISQDEVRHDLQQAGFNSIEFLESAYVVRATNKNGTKLVMTITPQDVRAIEVSPNRAGGNAAQGSIAGTPNPGAGVFGQAGNKNGPVANSPGTQATNENSQQNEAVSEQDSAKIPGKPGGKSGPAVNPPSGESK